MATTGKGKRQQRASEAQRESEARRHRDVERELDELEEQGLQARHRENERPPVGGGPPGSAGGGVHAAGAGAGGTAIGGLAGTNQGDGAVDADRLEEAAGSGDFDAHLEEEDEPPYSGRAGGAVGGTPAGKRGRGGR